MSYLCAANAGVDAAICYYPGGADKQLGQADKIKCPILFNFAGNDRLVTPEAVNAVKSAFAGRDNAVVEVYPDIDHGFNCWERAAYQQKMAALARSKSLAFLATTISG